MDRCKITRMNEGPHPIFLQILATENISNALTNNPSAHGSFIATFEMLLSLKEIVIRKIQTSSLIFLGSFVSDKIIHKTSCKYCQMMIETLFSFLGPTLL